MQTGIGAGTGRPPDGSRPDRRSWTGAGERELQTKTRASGSGGARQRTGRGRRETGDGQRMSDIDGKKTATTAREIERTPVRLDRRQHELRVRKPIALIPC
jgi:hypothetical protein